MSEKNHNMETEQLINNQIMPRKSKLILWIILSILGLVFLWTFFIRYQSEATTIRFMELIFLMLISLILLRLNDHRIETTQIDYQNRKFQKLKLNLWICLLILIALTFPLATFYWDSGLNLLFIELICMTLLSFVMLNYYDLPLVFFLIILFGLYTKRQHDAWAAEEMTLGTCLLSAIALFNTGKFLFIFKKNPFLRWFGFFAGIIIALFMTGMLYFNLHWSENVRMFLIFSGCSLFIIYVLALVFTLPNSNYIAWSAIERKVFFRAVLVPMVFIFALITLIVVFSHTYNSIMGRLGEGSFIFPYENNSIKLFDLEGILPI